jgi:hypothetical protein
MTYLLPMTYYSGQYCSPASLRGFLPGCSPGRRTCRCCALQRRASSASSFTMALSLHLVEGSPGCAAYRLQCGQTRHVLPLQLHCAAAQSTGPSSRSQKPKAYKPNIRVVTTLVQEAWHTDLCSIDSLSLSALLILACFCPHANDPLPLCPSPPPFPPPFPSQLSFPLAVLSRSPMPPTPPPPPLHGPPLRQPPLTTPAGL